MVHVGAWVIEVGAISLPQALRAVHDSAFVEKPLITFLVVEFQEEIKSVFVRQRSEDLGTEFYPRAAL